jgi:uncharacterized protein with FMN-binding domain
MPNAVKKISVAIVLALFYAANVFYERAHMPDLSMAASLQLSTLTQTPSADAQSSGSGEPPQQNTVAAKGSSSRTSVAAKQASAAGQVLVESASSNPAPTPVAQIAVKPSASSAPASKAITPPPVSPPPPGHVASSSSTPPPSSSNPPPAQAAQSQGQYKNGSYTGNSVDALFGMVQVQVTISNGSISNVQFLSYPNDNSTSLQKSNMAMPRLVQEAIAAQSASVQGVSGASETSAAFVQSLTNALSQAKV